jgi:hypothetical protein
VRPGDNGTGTRRSPARFGLTAPGGSTCDFVVNPGTGHTAWVQPGGTWWDPKVGPFLSTRLRLGGA